MYNAELISARVDLVATAITFARQLKMGTPSDDPSMTSFVKMFINKCETYERLRDADSLRIIEKHGLAPDFDLRGQE